MQLASSTFERSVKLSRVRRKRHDYLKLYSLLLVETGQQNRLALSPIAVCTWSDEDFVGRVSRAARACHGATVSVECMRRCLGLYGIQFGRFAAKERRRV